MDRRLGNPCLQTIHKRDQFHSILDGSCVAHGSARCRYEFTDSDPPGAPGSTYSLLMAQGVHPKIVSERLGHATVGITLDTYSRVLPGLQREAAAELDALLQRKKA